MHMKDINHYNLITKIVVEIKKNNKKYIKDIYIF